MIKDKNNCIISVGDAFRTDWGNVYDVSLERKAFFIENGEGGYEEVIMAVATSRKTGRKVNLLQFEGKKIQKIEPSSASDVQEELDPAAAALNAHAHCAAELFLNRELFRNGMITEADYEASALEIKEKYKEVIVKRE